MLAHTQCAVRCGYTRASCHTPTTAWRANRGPHNPHHVCARATTHTGVQLGWCRALRPYAYRTCSVSARAHTPDALARPILACLTPGRPGLVGEPALAMHPAFVEKLLWGGKVVGVRIALAAASPSVVKHLVQRAWANKAPKALVAQLAA